jgi:hypothetical protein
MHYTNEVDMPDMLLHNSERGIEPTAGLQKRYLITTTQLVALI